MIRPYSTLIADLDGTILKCGRYYAQACENVVDLVLRDHALDRTLVRELLDWLDVWAIRATNRGFTRDRFPRAAAAAMLVVEALETGAVDPAKVAEAHKVADSVFDAPYEPFDGALETLATYKRAGWRVFILTKGDPEVQSRKIEMHGIAKLVDHVEIVAKKNDATLSAFCYLNGIDPERTAYVGDSLRDDMTPAKTLGMFAARIATDPQDNWVHEATATDTVSDVVLEALAELPLVLPPDGVPVFYPTGN